VNVTRREASRGGPENGHRQVTRPRGLDP